MMTVEHLPFAAAKVTVCLAQTATRDKSNQMTSATMALNASRDAARVLDAQT